MKEVDKVSFFNRRDFSTLGTYILWVQLSHVGSVVGRKYLKFIGADKKMKYATAWQSATMGL